MKKIFIDTCFLLFTKIYLNLDKSISKEIITIILCWLNDNSRPFFKKNSDPFPQNIKTFITNIKTYRDTVFLGHFGNSVICYNNTLYIKALADLKNDPKVTKITKTSLSNREFATHKNTQNPHHTGLAHAFQPP